MSVIISPDNESVQQIHAIFLAIKELSQEMSEMRQYIGADFEVVNLRFDRLEDRLDRLESNLVYEH